MQNALTLLYAVNMSYYHIIKKLIWPGRIEPGGNSKQKYREKKGGVREMPAAAREARCKVRSHEPCGKI